MIIYGVLWKRKRSSERMASELVANKTVSRRPPNDNMAVAGAYGFSLLLRD